MKYIENVVIGTPIAYPSDCSAQLKLAGSI